jgi:amino acid transporter
MRGEAAENKSGLQRELTLPLQLAMGVGTILGAGIFVVIGEVIGHAGALAPFAYLLAAAVAIPTGLSYAECAARVPSSGGPVDYAEEAWRRKWLGSVIGWALLVAQLVSAATITTGFVSYLSAFVDVPADLVVGIVVAALTGVAIIGARQSAIFMAITTTVGLLTLAGVAVIGASGFVEAPAKMAEAGDGSVGGTASMLFSGSFLAMYSFIGFGDLAMTAEETQDVEKTLPRSIIGALILVLVVYVVISWVAVGAAPIDSLSGADAPLVQVVEAQGWVGWPIGVGSLFVIVNGALTQIITGSRLFLDIGRDGRGLPPVFGRVNETTNTPVVATLTSGAIVFLLAAFLPLGTLASITSLAILLVFATVNGALFTMKRRGQPDGVPDVPLALPIVGAALCTAAVVGQIVLWVADF